MSRAAARGLLTITRNRNGKPYISNVAPCAARSVADILSRLVHKYVKVHAPSCSGTQARSMGTNGKFENGSETKHLGAPCHESDMGNYIVRGLNLNVHNSQKS
jgi:hypothetical protein